VLMFGVMTSRAADSSNFGAVRVDRDVITLFPGGPNEYGVDFATNFASGPSSKRDADAAGVPHPGPPSWGLGVCGASLQGGRCRRGAM